MGREISRSVQWLAKEGKDERCIWLRDLKVILINVFRSLFLVDSQFRPSKGPILYNFKPI